MITSSDNKQVKKTADLLKKAKTRREEGCFVIEGVRLFNETPDSDIVNVFTSESFEADADIMARLSKLPHETVKDEVFKKMSDTVTSQGILAVVRIRSYDIKSLIKKDGLYLVLETIQDPGNLGTIMRTAEGAGVTAVIMSKDTVDIYSPKTVRATMGAIYRQPFVYTDDLNKTVDELKRNGIECYAAHLKGDRSYWDADFRKGSAIFIGNEGNGLSDEAKDLCDKLVKIPMEGKLESLNAAVSAALLSYEAKRQRSLKCFAGLFALAFLWMALGISSFASDTASDLLSAESEGATVVFDMKAYNSGTTENLGIEIEEDEGDEVGSDLVMANVKSALHVRAEADIESEIVGKIYKDCGGKVLERGEEWSLIETGELVGWASNEYLLFDEEAEALAREVGFTNVKVTAGAVYVRKEASKYSDFYGVLSQNAEYEVIDESEENWVKIAYGDYEGFVPRDGVKIIFEVDHGETMAVIKERKRLEEEARLAAIRQRESMQSEENVIRLLGALIQCEAGGEPYEGQVAVGAVVVNRVRSGAYPSTVYDVIYASGQFTPAKSGSLSRVYNKGPKESCLQAARQALGGYTNVGDATHFRRKGTKEGLIIGNHVFY